MGWLDDARAINAEKAREAMEGHVNRNQRNKEFLAEQIRRDHMTEDRMSTTNAIQAAQAEELLRSIFGDLTAATHQETGVTTREPNYVRRDENHVHLYLHSPQEGGASDERFEDVDTRFQAVADALEMLRERIDGIAAYLEAQRQVTEQTARFEKVNERPDFYVSDVDTVATKPVQIESPLRYYLDNKNVTQQDVARHFHMRTSAIRDTLWAEAAASGLVEELQERTKLGNRNGGHAAQESMRRSTLERARMELSSEAYR